MFVVSVSAIVSEPVTSKFSHPGRRIVDSIESIQLGALCLGIVDSTESIQLELKFPQVGSQSWGGRNGLS